MAAELPAGIVTSGGRRVPKAQIADRAARAAAGFRQLARPGMETLDVAILLRNDFPFLEATLGAYWGGAYAAPINWHQRAAETGAILDNLRPAAFVVHADLLAPVLGAVPPETTIIVVPTPDSIRDAYRIDPALCTVPAGLLTWDTWLADQTPVTDPMPGSRAVIYTSGTTSLPKGVRRMATDPDVLARALAGLMRNFRLEPVPGERMRVAMPGPMYHSATFSYSMGALRMDTDLHLMERFDATALLRLIAEERISHMHIVPTMFTRLLRLPEGEKAGFDVSSLRSVIHGAAPCPTHVKKAMIDWWGPVIGEYYGASEASLITCIDSPDWLERPGSVGPANPNVVMEIRDGAGAVLPPGETGEIFVRLGPTNWFRYNGKPETWGETAEGQFYATGDIGHVDADGFLYLSDRAKDMIISGGVNIYPSEIEEALLAHPSVRDAAVFGIPDEEYGEAICAAVEVSGDVTADALQAWVADRLAKYKAPRVITFHSALPREDSGKIFKRRLRDPYWQDRDRKV